MSFLFVSHRSSDDDYVDDLVSRLNDESIETWADHINGFGPSDDFDLAIQNALNECEHCLVVFSNDTFESQEARSEIRYLIEEGKRIYVARIEEIHGGKFHWRLSTIAYVDLFKNPASFDTLVDAIKNNKILNLAHDDVNIERRLTSTRAIDPRLLIDIYGRDDDLGMIESKLAKGFPTFITGIGGSGKSRLAYELALKVADVSGVVWHECSDVSSPDDILDLLRSHIALPIETSVDTVIRKVSAHRLLVVIDNAESIQDSNRRTGFIQLTNQLSQNGSKVLFTSREMWHDMPRAQQHTPMGLPNTAATEVCLAMCEIENVSVTDHQANELAEKALKHPRLIDLAVTMCKTRDFEHVIESLDNLQGSRIEEQLNEMFLQTIELMKQTNTTYGHVASITLKRLNVCRGGFTIDAAKSLAIGLPGTDLPHNEDDLYEVLDVLQKWKFVRRHNEDGRFSIDMLLIAALGEDDAVYDEHYEYFSVLTDRHSKMQDYSALTPEIDNLSAAFQRKLDVDNTKDAYLLCHKCRPLFFNRMRFAEWQEWLAQVQPKIEQRNDNFLKAHLLGTLGDSQAGTLVGNRASNLKSAIAYYRSALEYFTAEQNELMHAVLVHNLGHAYWILSEHENRASNLQKAISCFEVSLNTTSWSSGTIRSNLGNCYSRLGQVSNNPDDLEKALDLFNESLTYTSPTNEGLSYANTLYNRATTYLALARYKNFRENADKAISSVQAALQILTPANDPMAYGLARYNQALIHYDLAQTDNNDEYLHSAEEGFTESLHYYSRNHDPGHRAMILQALGLTKRKLGYTEVAISLWIEAKECFEIVSDFERANYAQSLIDNVDNMK